MAASYWALTFFVWYGFMTPEVAYTVGVFGWVLGSFVTHLVIGGILVKVLTPFVKRSPLWVKTFWR